MTGAKPMRADEISTNLGREPGLEPTGGARRDRTDDLLLAKQALSQLSYGPVRGQRTDDGEQKEIPSSVVCGLAIGGPGTTRTSDLTLIRGAL